VNARTLQAWGQYYNFINISPKNLPFWAKNSAMKFMTLVFNRIINFFAEYWPKPQKIVNIRLTHERQIGIFSFTIKI
jgi:hypothetical protein